MEARLDLWSLKIAMECDFRRHDMPSMSRIQSDCARRSRASTMRQMIVSKLPVYRVRTCFHLRVSGSAFDQSDGSNDSETDLIVSVLLLHQGGATRKFNGFRNDLKNSDRGKWLPVCDQHLRLLGDREEEAIVLRAAHVPRRIVDATQEAEN